MKTSQNTILITGGGSGIGFETAKLLSELGNTVILVGRNKEKLEAAAGKLHNAHFIVADVTSEQDVDGLVDTIYKNFPAVECSHEQCRARGYSRRQQFARWRYNRA